MSYSNGTVVVGETLSGTGAEHSPLLKDESDAEDADSVRCVFGSTTVKLIYIIVLYCRSLKEISILSTIQGDLLPCI